MGNGQSNRSATRPGMVKRWDRERGRKGTKNAEKSAAIQDAHVRIAYPQGTRTSSKPFLSTEQSHTPQQRQAYRGKNQRGNTRIVYSICDKPNKMSEGKKLK